LTISRYAFNYAGGTHYPCNIVSQSVPKEIPMIRFLLAFVFMVPLMGTPSSAEEIGTVDTAFKLLGANHKIAIEAFDDPKVEGVTCFLSMARKGGITGSLGLAEDTSDASIACRQVGPIKFLEKIAGKGDSEKVFRKRRSILFKNLHVVRFFNAKRNTLIYLAYSDKLIDGSPQNSVSAVAVMPWGNTMPAKPITK
jgi:CreA protein